VSTAWSRMARAWNRFWFDDIDGVSFGLVRIGIALSGLAWWGSTIGLLEHFYTDLGEFPLVAARVWTHE